MKLEFHGREERYAAEQSLLNLFPGELPVCGSILPGDGAWARVTCEEQNDRLTVTADLFRHGRTGACRRDAPLSGGEYEREGQRRHAVTGALYLAYRDMGGPPLPWGALTGVRPVKLPTRALRAGASLEQAREMLEREYFVSPLRAELAADCARASLAAERSLAAEEVSLYVGIPFCPTRCAYCSFVSADVRGALRLVEPYVDALLKEAACTGQAMRERGLRVRTFYMGGGTPTTLSAGQMDRLLSGLRAALPMEGCTEYTVEAGRPDTITREKLEVLRRHGAGRVSINPQSLDDRVLAAIGREHTAGEVRAAFALAREAGFGCINMDLIAGLPLDSAGGFARSLEGVLEMGPENITVHTLARKRGSRLGTPGGESGTEEAAPGAGEALEMLDGSIRRLREAGCAPYYLYRQKYMTGGLENVGWTVPGAENIYNICMMEELHTVVSLGAGGVTKLVDRTGGAIRRISNPKYPQEYLSRLDRVLEQKRGLFRVKSGEDVGI